MPSKETSESLAAYWRPRIEAWESSGQTQRDFCRSHDLNYTRFVYWRQRFKDETRKTQRQASSTLVPVTYRPAPLESGLSLVLPNGIELRGIGSDNLAVVEKLLSRL